MTSKTIALTGDETRVDYGCGTNVWLRNDGTDVIYASTSPGITAGADGTASIPAGQAMRIDGTCGTVYLLGTGSVQLVGSDYTACPFKTSTSTGGESGVDEVARAAISAHSANTDIHVTAAEKTAWNGLSNPNLLINPNFAINQRGITTADGGTDKTYIADHWYVSRAAASNDGGVITAAWDGVNGVEGYLQQQIEGTAGLFGERVSVSFELDGEQVSAALTVPTVVNETARTAVANDVDVAISNYCGTHISIVIFFKSTKSHTVGSIKAELGGRATPFVPPDPATELAKCQRYLLKLSQWSAYRAVHSNVNYMEFAVPIPESMRISPTIIGGNNFAVYKFPSPVAAESDFTFSVSAASANELRVRATKAGHGLSDAALHVVGEDGVSLSAEL